MGYKSNRNSQQALVNLNEGIFETNLDMRYFLLN
jgi:hypothetical protein